MAVLKWMLKLALFPLLLLLILAQWVGIFLTTFSTILTNLLAGLSLNNVYSLIYSKLSRVSHCF